jgi:Domain of unknown function (DUF397)
MTDHTAPTSPRRATGWRKSSYSKGANDCVEVTTATPGQVSVRDSKLGPTSPILTVTTAHWHALLTWIRTNTLNT